jgi:hypothetical protein
MRLLVALSMSTLLGSPAAAATHVVNSVGTGDFPNIQTAIDAAADGDTVALEDGVFTGDGNRDLTFRGKALVLRSSSGDRSACIIDAEGSPESLHRGIQFVDAEGPDAVVEGLTIQGAYLWNSANGGGILCGPEAGPTIRDCVLRDNVAFRGGGLAVDLDAHPSIIGCVFSGNFAGEGGGISYATSRIPTAVTVFASRFERNECNGHGGGAAVAASSGSANRFVDCLFVDNYAHTSGGGFFTCGQGLGLFLGCTFARNLAEGGGAGMT